MRTAMGADAQQNTIVFRSRGRPRTTHQHTLTKIFAHQTFTPLMDENTEDSLQSITSMTMCRLTDGNTARGIGNSRFIDVECLRVAVHGARMMSASIVRACPSIRGDERTKSFDFSVPQLLQ